MFICFWTRTIKNTVYQVEIIECLWKKLNLLCTEFWSLLWNDLVLWVWINNYFVTVFYSNSNYIPVYSLNLLHNNSCFPWIFYTELVNISGLFTYLHSLMSLCTRFWQIKLKRRDILNALMRLWCKTSCHMGKNWCFHKLGSGFPLDYCIMNISAM